MTDYFDIGFAFATGVMFTLAIVVFAIGHQLVVSSIGHQLSNEYTIEEIRQYDIDCKVKEYYYMDTHRTLCDKIGVKP